MIKHRTVAAGIAVFMLASIIAGCGPTNERKFRELSVAEYRDKMKAGWVGQMAGVGWGAPTEFKWQGKIIPVDKMPGWLPQMVNQFQQDDIYVEMTFIRSMEEHGLDVPIRQAGIDFANSGYMLWHANNAGRTNLRNGIAPPDSGHPKFNRCADDIDYQIEADFSGLIAPGMPNTVIALGEKFGRLMNYGDGVYGGQFVGGMYAEAFFEEDPLKIVEAGLRCIPEKSLYAETIRDVIRWWKENPDNWQATWKKINDKYHLDGNNRRFSCSGPKGTFNIDAKINGAFIVMGLLYGERNIDQTIVISCRCGQDSDCNPANSGGVLFTTIGFSKLPKQFTEAISPTGKFSHTPYTFPLLIDVCEKLARQAVVKQGGKIVMKGGEEYFLIPVRDPEPGPLMQCWEPGPIADSRFTVEEMRKISSDAQVSAALNMIAPGWRVQKCGSDMHPGLRREFQGKENVLLTHPVNEQVPCVLSRKTPLPRDEKIRIRLVVGHHKMGDWVLVVRADGKEIFNEEISEKTCKDTWRTVEVSLKEWAGKEVTLEVENRASGWNHECGLFQEISVTSK